ncbi:MAG TPA: hypothetical protein PK142_01790 [bacterium]|nr:hypothetical protein [bacterium]
MVLSYFKNFKILVKKKNFKILEKRKNFKVLGGSLVLSGITYQSTYLIVPGATINYSEFFANFFPIIILGIMAVIAIFAIAQNLKKGEENNNNLQ